MRNLIRVLIADDNSLVRRGVRAMLESADDVDVVGEAEDGQEAVDLVESLNPDVVVMDIFMPRLDGLKATKRIQAMKSATRVLILSMHPTSMFVRQALGQGARGYILKRKLSEDLLPALYRVNDGGLYLSRALKEIATSD